MKRKLLVSVLIAAFAVVCLMAFAACGEHTHRYTDTIVPPTCTEEGYTEHKCSCGKSYRDNEVEAHNSIVYVEYKAATCAEQGNIAYYKCSLCYKYYSDENGKNEITDKRSVIIPEPHNYVDGVCTICGVAQHTEGLKYTKYNGYAEVSGLGTVTDTEIYIAEEYEGLPVTSIGYEAFKECKKLTSVTIPETVTSIQSRAFERCGGLKSINMPDGITSIGSSAFEWCKGLTSITIPDGVTSIGSSAFNGCTGLTNINIPNSIISIGDFAFNGCTGLTSITIPDGVTRIGKGAFGDCSGFASIEIPETVTNIGENAFENTAYYNDDNNWENDVLYIGKHLIKAKETLSGDYRIKTDTLTIAYCAFYGCSGLTSVTIPKTVKSIGYQTFYRCGNLKSIEVPDGVTSIGTQAFYECGYLTSIEIPETVTSIGYKAFSYCRSLTSIEIPEAVTGIGDEAFSYCSGLASITIPDSVVSMYSSSFYDTAYFKDSSNWENGVLYIGKHLIKARTTLSGNYQVKSGTLTIADFAFVRCTELTGITISDSVTSIGNSAF